MVAKYCLLLLVVFGGLVFKVHSFSIVNNETVSSDALSDIFLKFIQSNPEISNISAHESKEYNPAKCLISLREIINQFPSLKVAPFLDSWGKFPSGILYGNLFDFGNFDQCVGTSVTLSKLTGSVRGQYCFASIPLVSQQAQSLPSLNGALVPEPKSAITDWLKIVLGICVPDSCSSDFLTELFRLSASNVLGGSLSGVSVSLCRTTQKPALSPLDVFAITFFSIILALMVSSSIYDFMMTYFKKQPVPILLAFSVLTNGKKLFAITTEKSANTIDCLTGIRVFSMLWVMYGHTYSLSLVVPKINTIDILSWLKAPWSMHVLNASMSVDSFFFISGVLVAWLGFRELDRTKGRLNVLMMYVHRYIRLTPPLAAFILFIVSFNKFIGSGPYRQTAVNLDGCTKDTWWPVLLYIQNYYIQPKRCVGQSWYLAIDFQLYILSPLLLIPMWKWGKKFGLVLVVLALLSIGCVMATFITEGYTDLTGMYNENAFEKTYVPMHTRYAPWLVGFGLGYFMHMNREKKIHLSKVLQLLGWTVSFVIFVSIVFAPYFTIHNRGRGTVFETAVNESMRRVSWAVGLAWITFACQFGYGGTVNTFLSHPFWQPLGRLTYSLFIVHIFILTVNYGVMRTEMFFSDYNQILNFWSTFGISLMAAIALTLAFESPVLVLEKAIFGKGSQQRSAQKRSRVSDNSVVEPETKDV